MRGGLAGLWALAAFRRAAPRGAYQERLGQGCTRRGFGLSVMAFLLGVLFRQVVSYTLVRPVNRSGRGVTLMYA